MTTLYGISNCDTIKKAKKYLTDNNIDFNFHDYRKDGISLDMITEFATHIDWQDLVNKRGTTYRQLSDEQKQNLDKDTALAILVAQPAMIKRPVLIRNNSYHLGFKPAQYDEIFAS
ncbi:ArsC family reductase [Pseudoalteromonas sp. SR44-5]|uniref:ArsC family reductase n=1 Tax=Pseudoalteromonas rhizosphaerae TaxID=2518973 RepID=A0ABW8KZL3_9GAMM|nr:MULTISPECIES: ArsC family reductase [unclassified Pseudoalteromonas]MBB1366206.1 ArsC family reductase [Pseudoalteromonas sp. SR44-5]MBB1408949.1 ArsC family reductase [Pseudoalteromonas sp. SG44-17]MBB1416415.1 ArsC family reductase [Pseudoalteromonas sp. SG44-1]MBB1466904.1 ArsC family reductase [Pseudoalteromonas sp. SG41-5]MBB1479907.1 ArsC family reductase [Pseudoalteromonas sp. SG41-2]